MLTTEGEREELLALITDVNHTDIATGPTAGVWATLKAKLKILLSAPRAINAAIDAGIAENAAAQRRFEQDVLATADDIAAERDAHRARPATD